MLYMIRTQFYLPPHIHKLLQISAKNERKSMAQKIRELLDAHFHEQEAKEPVLALLCRNTFDALADLSENHDRYLYGKQ